MCIYNHIYIYYHTYNIYIYINKKRQSPSLFLKHWFAESWFMLKPPFVLRCHIIQTCLCGFLLRTSDFTQAKSSQSQDICAFHRSWNRQNLSRSLSSRLSFSHQIFFRKHMRNFCALLLLASAARHGSGPSTRSFFLWKYWIDHDWHTFSDPFYGWFHGILYVIIEHIMGYHPLIAMGSCSFFCMLMR